MSSSTNIEGNLNVKGQYQSPLTTYTPTGTTQTIDWNTVGNSVILDLGSASGNITVTLSNGVSGSTYLIKIIQAATARSITYSPTLKWVGGAEGSLSTADNAVDILSLFYDGSNYYAILNKTFA